MDTPLFDGELVHARRMIYTPSAFAKSNLVHLQEVGQLQARSPHASTRKAGLLPVFGGRKRQRPRWNMRARPAC